MEEAIIYVLYIRASFAKDKLPIGAWVYLWAFYLVWNQEGWFFQLFFFLKITLVIQGYLCFHINCIFVRVCILWKMPLVIW